jgi:hypothetical protein
MRAVCLDIADLRDGRREPLSRTPTRHGQPAFLSLSTAWQCFTTLEPRPLRGGRMLPRDAIRAKETNNDAGPLIPLPLEYEDSGHSSPTRLTAGIDPTTAAPSVDNNAGSCPFSVIAPTPAASLSGELESCRVLSPASVA